MATPSRRIKNPVLFICDIQDKFRPAIHAFPTVIATAQKLLKASAALKIPVVATTQQRAKLGETCAELELGTTYAVAADVDKSAFSMWVPEVASALRRLPKREVDVSRDSVMDQKLDVLIVGIESHICVLQTSLDALRHGHRVWVVADGVSSCNAEERGLAFARLRQEGARVTTSESILYEILGDAKDPNFRDISGLVKETKASTKEGLQTLCNF